MKKYTEEFLEDMVLHHLLTLVLEEELYDHFDLEGLTKEDCIRALLTVETRWFECQECGEVNQCYWECPECGYDDLLEVDG